MTHLVPPETDLVETSSPWVEIARQAFYDTPSILRTLKVRPAFATTEADRMQTLMILNAVPGSRQYPHPIKLRQAATLMSLWCEV